MWLARFLWLQNMESSLPTITMLHRHVEVIFHIFHSVKQPMRALLEKTLSPTRSFAEKSDLLVSCYAYKENVSLASTGSLYRVFWKLFTNVSEQQIVSVPVNMHTAFSCDFSLAIRHATSTRSHCLEHENIDFSWCENFEFKTVVFWVVWYLVVLSWRWRQRVPPKRMPIYVRVHADTSQKITLIFSSVVDLVAAKERAN